jgi:6-pyruvoyl-tetrahydropterin synthase
VYSLTVCNHFMIAHSFCGEVFGPAQKLHGATYAVELEIQAPTLDAHGLVADIGRLETMLKTIIDALNYRNLDDEPAFAGVNTTTEFLAGELWQRARQAISAGALEPSPPPNSMKLTLRESPTAWAAYAAPLQ